jgi:membrane-associated phospholipid phosphatase
VTTCRLNPFDVSSQTAAAQHAAPLPPPSPANSRLREARDYNRGLWLPVRVGHFAAASLSSALAPILAWARDGARSAWAVPAVWGLLAFVLLLPFDAAVSRAAMWINANLGGDPRRELMALQQYGQLTISLVVALIIWIIDPERRAKLFNWLVAWALAAALVFPMKWLVGRPRPRFGDGSLHPYEFLGPWGAWPLGLDRAGNPRGVRHAWELWAPISSDLHSMPSSHTAYAVVMSLVLVRFYPKLRAVLFALAAIVAACRILFGGHYLTDVVIGAACGAIAVRLAFEAGWGQALRLRLHRPGSRAVH